MKYTHKTKKGFGGLLAAGIECYIVESTGKKCSIRLKGRGSLLGEPPLFHGELKDLYPIETEFQTTAKYYWNTLN